MRVKRPFGYLMLVASAVAVITSDSITVSADNDVDAVVYNGVIANLLPFAVPPVDDGVLGVGVVFTYDFAGGCVVALSSDDLPSTSGCNITGTGTYTNVDCGTGILAGTMTVASPVDTINAEYVTILVGGIGVTDMLVGGGFVSLSPTNSSSGGCIIAPVSSFNVSGTFAIFG